MSLGTIINGNTSSSTVSTNPEAQKNFQISNYGRISGGFEKENHIEAPILNVVNDKDTQLTGFGTSGATVNIYSDGQLLGSTVVDADGRWILSLEAPLKEGTKVEASQVINGEESEKVSQIVSHLSSDTVNFFKYGYLQSYGLILEGSIDNGDLDLSNKDAVKKTINLVNENGDIVQSSEVANTDWYNPGVFNGYQAMLTNEMLATVKEGSYKLTVTLTVGDFTETQDLNVSNARYVGHTIFDQIEALNTGTNTVKTVNKGGIGYLTITNN
ncbi:Ig-like domain-containing protein [Lactococcus garvieae]|uniref:Ig-like domain-containing protein n=1 Tax=Lactococcus garvieae TaxID=1363 RepID=UPI00398ED48E